MDAAVAANDRRARETAEVGHARRDLEQVAAAVLTVPLLLSMAGVALPGWLALALATPVQLGVGARFYIDRWKGLRAGTGNMDLLVALGTSAAYLDSLFLVASGAGGHTYFEAAAAQAKKAPVQRLVDRVAAVFVPVVLACALVAFLGWYLIAGSFAGGLAAAVAVLVIACPCTHGRKGSRYRRSASSAAGRVAA